MIRIQNFELRKIFLKIKKFNLKSIVEGILNNWFQILFEKY